MPVITTHSLVASSTESSYWVRSPALASALATAPEYVATIEWPSPQSSPPSEDVVSSAKALRAIWEYDMVSITAAIKIALCVFVGLDPVVTMDTRYETLV